MEPDPTPRLPRAAKRNSRERGNYNTASTLPKPGASTPPTTRPSDNITTPNATAQAPTKGGKGKEQAVHIDADVDLDDDDDDDDDEGRVAPRRRPLSVMQEIRKNNPKMVSKTRAVKAKQDRIAANAAKDPPNSDHAGPATTANKRARKPNARKPAKTTAKGKATKSPAIQDGQITRPTKAKQTEKPERIHRPSKWNDNESVPDGSDEEQLKENTIAKLRETVNRHARWCPFVQLNKKLHRVHRRTKRLETADFEDTSEGAAPETDNLEDDGENAGPEEDESAAQSDEAENSQPSKTTQSKQTAKQAAPKKAAAKKASSKTAPTSKGASKKAVSFEEPIPRNLESDALGDVEADNDSETDASEEDMSEKEDGVGTNADAASSDDELSSLDNEILELTRPAYIQEQMHSNDEAIDPPSDKGAGGKKRLHQGPELGLSAKKQRLQIEETRLEDETAALDDAM